MVYLSQCFNRYMDKPILNKTNQNVFKRGAVPAQSTLVKKPIKILNRAPGLACLATLRGCDSPTTILIL